MEEQLSIDNNYIYIYKFIKYSIFIILTLLIIYLSLNKSNENTPYKTILTITTLMAILFYILDTNFPVCNFIYS